MARATGRDLTHYTGKDMTTFFKTTALACALALISGASMAQDAAPVKEIPTLETAQVGDVYLAEKSDPWELRCTKVEAGQGPCQVFQLLRDETGGAVAEFNMFAIPEGKEAVAGAVVVVPLETLLEAGLIIQVDDAPAKGYSFAYCTGYGCIARVGFTAEELDAMKAGTAAKLTIVPAKAKDVKVNLTLSLAGFTDLFEKTKPVQ
jgi:invasion protein IalB